MNNKIGLSLDAKMTIENGKEILDFLFNIGCTSFELDNFEQIYTGHRLSPCYLRELKSLINNSKLGVSLHGPHCVDFRETDEYEWHKRLFLMSLELASEIGSNVVVTHFGARTDNPEVEKKFKEILYEMAGHARKYGVTIGLENQEIDIVQPVIDMVKEFGHPNFKMTFDVGHAFLASNKFGFDFLGTLRQALPYIVHTHLHDNLGQFDNARLLNKQKGLSARLPLGKGDLHMPVGWGLIPYKEVMEILRPNYDGIYILEYDSGIQAKVLPEVFANTKRILGL